MTADRFCSGDGLSWTDLVTNVVKLSGTRSVRMAQAMATWSSAPLDLMQSYLHEAAHHAFFFSPLGDNLASLYLSSTLRSQGLASNLQVKDGNSVSRTFSDETVRLARIELMHHDVMKEVLRPLIEGIALFAEFDATCRGATEYHTKPMVSALHMFHNGPIAESPPQEEERVRPWIWLHVFMPVLREVRLADAATSRKAVVYGLPFGLDGGGYLLGYMTVCRAWEKLGERIPLFRSEADLFFGYVSDFFTRDYSLIALLLDTSIDDEREFLDRCIAHIAARLDALVNDVRLVDVEGWYSPVLRDGNDRSHSEDPAWLLVSKRSDVLGRAMEENLRRRLRSYESDPLRGRAVRELLWLLPNRRIVPVWSIEAEIRVAGPKFELTVDGAEIMSGAVQFPNVKDGVGAGSIDVYFVMDEPPTLGRICLISRGGDVIAHWVLAIDGYIERLRRDTMRRIVRRRSAGAVFDSFQQAVTGYVERNRANRLLQLPTFRAEVADVYSRFALWPLSGAAIEEHVQRMKEFGIVAALEGDQALVDHLAFLGLSRSVSKSGELYLNGDEQQDELTHRLDEVSKRLGLKLVTMRGDSIVNHI